MATKQLTLENQNSKMLQDKFKYVYYLNVTKFELLLRIELQHLT